MKSANLMGSYGPKFLMHGSRKFSKGRGGGDPASDRGGLDTDNVLPFQNSYPGKSRAGEGGSGPPVPPLDQCMFFIPSVKTLIRLGCPAYLSLCSMQMLFFIMS